jgi:glycosyltransferase involved in cell wall biosynthesis
MKVALLTDGIAPYVLGGMQRHSFFVAKYLAKKGVFVDLYHCNQSSLNIEALEVFTEEERKYIRSFVLQFPAPGKLPGHYIRESYAYSSAIFNLLKDQLQGVDFIYAKGFCAWRLLREKEKGFVCPPVGVKFHGLNMFQTLPGFKGWLNALLFRPFVKYNMLHADYNFSYGGKITSITERVGVPKEKIISIPTGITNDWYSGPSGIHSPRSFIYVGRYERLKGVEEMSAAIQQLKGVDFTFHFVGPIPEDKKINDPRVIYHGETRSTEQLKQLYDKADVLLCPSYSEGMPNCIIEALSRGLAVIATDVGANEVMVKPSNGWLINTCDISLIKGAMIEAIALTDAELSKRKSASFTIAKEKLSWESIAEELFHKIELVIQSAKSVD